MTSRKRLTQWFAATALILGAGTGVSAAAPLATYVNARYGYLISYPSSLLTPLPESDSGDGREFQAKSGTAKFTVFASYTVPELGETPRSIAADAENECPGRKAPYRVVKSQLVAISCNVGADILYQKTLIRSDATTTLMARYPRAQKSLWDPVVLQMAGSLTAAHRSY